MTVGVIESDLYGPEYYASHCGTVPYERNAHWLAFFGGIADRIIASFGPGTVYDAGCALGFLVEALWDRGVAAYGRDISAFAISTVRPDMAGFCEVGDIAQPPPVPGVFELVTCIEVLEHMPEHNALAAMDQFVVAAPRVLFSSSPSDFAEPTHINVRPSLYWLRQFAQRGFSPDWTHDATYLSPHAFVVVRSERPPGDGELRLFAEWIRVRTALIEREQRIGRLSHELLETRRESQRSQTELEALRKDFEHLESQGSLTAPHLDAAREEIVVVATSLQSAHTTNAALQQELRDGLTRFTALRSELETQLNEARQRAHAIETSRTWRATGLARSVVSRVPGARAAISRLAHHGRPLLPGRLKARLLLPPATPVTALVPPDFDPAAYVAANPDVEAAGVDPATHWVTHGEAEGRQMTTGQPPVPYAAWIVQEQRQGFSADLQRRLFFELPLRPLISVLTPVYKIAADILDDTIASVVAQTYPQWELCLAVADTGDAERMAMLDRWAAREPRVRVQILAENGGISRNSDAALAMATGEWAVLLDHDDILTQNALFELARALNDDPNVDFLYSDKDQVGADGTTRQHPLFKPAWGPEIMLGANYLTHLNMMRVDRLRAIGGWDATTDGAQDWDLFLRAIGPTGRVRHVPKVLYHWRQVPSSVAGGGAAAKPYAADAQLRAIGRYLTESGWPDAKPGFEGPFVRIAWSADFRPSITLVVLGNGVPPTIPAYDWPDSIEIVAAPDAKPPGARAIAEASGPPGAVLDALVAASRGDVVVIWDSGLESMSPDWLAELVGPLANPKIAAVGGAVLRGDSTLSALGAFYANGETRPGFQGLPLQSSGPFGSPCWYNNASMTPLRLAALRRSEWIEAGGCKATGDVARPDLALSWRLTQRGGRILLNPYAMARAVRGDPFAGADEAAIDRMADWLATAMPDGDPFMSPHLTFAQSGWLTFRVPHATPAPDHNFGEEARYLTHAMNATRDDIRQSVDACAAAPSGPLRRVGWVVPNFDVAFYGGIHTILRAADHMLRLHQVHPVFSVLGARNAEIIRTRIGKAFPVLAREATIVVLPDTDHDSGCGEVDALICTLWVTAYAVLRDTKARRKLYFLQDWEPLFYPGGSISGLVEATYQFGFHAVCNTKSLAASYRSLGGTAEHFVPATDPSVFHPRRAQRPKGGPIRLFCYARPAAPRNCFETLTAALRKLKDTYGEGIDIVTAGGWWEPSTYELEGVVRHLGLLAYADTGLLYRACDIGLVAMATRHPSYLPFELMACGAAVVTNRNPYTEWLLHDGENAALCDLTSGDVARAVSQLIDDPAALQTIVEGGYATVARDHSDWEATCARIHAIIEGDCKNAVK